MPDDPVTLGELSRRFDAMEHRFEVEFVKLGSAIAQLRFVHIDQYRAERDAIAHRIDEVSKDLAEMKEDRKWMVRAIVASILFPLVVAFVLAVAIGGGM